MVVGTRSKISFGDEPRPSALGNLAIRLVDSLRFIDEIGEVEGPASAFGGGPSSSSIDTGSFRDPPASLCARSLLAVADARLGNGSSSGAPSFAFLA